MNQTERQAGELLGELLIAANLDEFFGEVGRILQWLENGEIVPQEALWQIKTLHDLASNCNQRLREITRS